MEKVLRKLGKKETYQVTIDDDCEKLISVSKIESKIDLVKFIDVLEQGIFEWKRLNPFLNCCLMKINEELYFSHSSNDTKNSIQNVRVLSYDNPTDDDIEKHLIELLVEKEICTNFDLFNELFWRITFFKTKSSEKINDDLFTYSVIFTVHHCICEAKYKYLSLIELFGLIENIYNKNYVTREKFNVLKPLEDLFTLKDNIELEFSYPKIPIFIDMANAKSKLTTKDDTYKNLIQKNGWIKDSFNKNPSQESGVSIENLFKISDANKSKFRFIKYEREKFELIIHSCKKFNIKLNGCLNMILVIAHKLLYDKFETSKSVSKIHYFNSVSLRKYLNPSEDREGQKFCYLVSNIFKQHKFKSEQKCFKDYLSSFWQDAKAESEDFHRRLNDKEYLINWKWSDCNVAKDEMFFDYFCANLGPLPSFYYHFKGKKSEKPLIKVLESYDVMNLPSDSCYSLTHVITSTIENNLFWSIMFSSVFIGDDCIDYLCDSIVNIMNELIK